MKTLIKTKIWIGIISSFLLIAFGAYYFAMGNIKISGGLFLAGIISTIISLTWLFAFAWKKKDSL